MMGDELGEIGRLRAENAALRERVDALEKALAERSNGHAPDGAARPDEAAVEAHAAVEWMPTSVPALIHWRPDGAVTRWNDGAERLFGWTATEALGRRLADLVAANPVSPAAVEAFQFPRDESRFAVAVSEARTKEGQTIVCRWTYAVLRDDRGEVREIATIADDTSDRQRREQAVHGRYRLLLQLVDNARSNIFVKDAAGRYVFINRTYAQALERHAIEVIGLHEHEVNILSPEDVESLVAKEREVLAAGKVLLYDEVVVVNGEKLHFSSVKFPIYDARGELVGLGGIVTETTSLRRAEAERAALQEEIIVAQKAALRELSTPLIPIADKVVAMPLVGTIDGTRAAQIMETLLDGISGQGAHTAILDITGVRAVDTLVADALTRTARAAQLLGTRVLLTGVRPEVAQTLISLGVDFSGITTLSTLQSGIAHALRNASR